MASELVGQVMGILGSTVYEELRQVYGVKSRFQKLKKSLSAINAVLKDAEEQEHNCNTTRNWLANLKDVVYDIEDLFDKISTEVLKRNVRGRRRRCIGRLLAPGIRLYSRYTLTQEVNEICDRLDEIGKNRSNFNLTISQSAPVENSTGQQEETYSCIRESEVFGREQDKEWIVSHLVSFSRHEEEKFLVIPLFGIGGIGKTTLAKLVYNDARVEADENFKLRFWTHVKNFCPKAVIEDMIQCATGQSCSNWSLQALHENVQRILKGANFFIVSCYKEIAPDILDI